MSMVPRRATHLDNLVKGLLVASTRWAANILWQAAVQGDLTALKARPRARAAARLLATVAKTAGGTLTSSNAAAFPCLALASSW
eukprot:6204145-Pleurochrysis_carterae.AAC.3